MMRVAPASPNVWDAGRSESSGMLRRNGRSRRRRANRNAITPAYLSGRAKSRRGVHRVAVGRRATMHHRRRVPALRRDHRHRGDVQTFPTINAPSLSGDRAADEAHRTWSSLDGEERAALVRRSATARRTPPELAIYRPRDGKPITQALGEVDFAVRLRVHRPLGRNS